MARRPRIAMIMGDPAGVGPEMAVKLLSRPANLEAADICVIAPPSLVSGGERVAGAKLRFEAGDGVRFTHLAMRETGEAPVGECTPAAGAAVLEALAKAVDLAREKKVDAILFAPMNKHSLRLAGMLEEDELRYMQKRFGVDGFVCEFNITGALWTSRVTSHVPVREVADLITPQAVRDAVLIIDGALKRSGIARPRIAVSGLNPHAGDGGSIGREEIEVIAPAIEALRKEGIEASGPWSPDTVFIAARRGDFNAVVSMYHDQGQIAMKLMGFASGVTLHGGLPVPVATSASGSAFDIAGRNVAGIEGLQAAFDLCVRMVN